MTTCIVSDAPNPHFQLGTYSAMSDKDVLSADEVKELFPYVIDAQRAIRLAADLVRLRFRVEDKVSDEGLSEEERTVALVGMLLSAVYSDDGVPNSSDALSCIATMRAFVAQAPTEAQCPIDL